MRKTALVLAAAASLGASALAVTPAAADAGEPFACALRYPGHVNAYRYDPYTWIGYPNNYSNFTAPECGYYRRHFYGAYTISHVRYVRRYYR